MAPAATDFFIVPGSVDRSREDYEAYWSRVRASVVDKPAVYIVVNHHVSAPSFNRYRPLR